MLKKKIKGRGDNPALTGAGGTSEILQATVNLLITGGCTESSSCERESRQRRKLRFPTGALGTTRIQPPDTHTRGAKHREGRIIQK